VRWRLIAALVGVTLVVLIVHDLPLTFHLRNVERNTIITGLERDAFTIAGRAEEDLQNQTAIANSDLQDLVNRYTAAEGARVVITDRDGTAMVISDEEDNAGTNYGTRPEIQAALDGTPVAGTRRSNTLDMDVLYVAVPVRGGEKIRGAVRITYPAGVVDDRVGERVRGIVVVALISLITAAIAAFALAGTITRPLRRLTAATEDVARGDLTVRAPVDEGPPEIRNLAVSFNTMSEQVANLVEEQRAFTSDASHQLRTPLTALRIRLEQAAEIAANDPVAARDRIESANAEVERLQRMVEGLLALARAEGSATEIITADISAAARERGDVWISLAEEQGVLVTVATPGRVDVLTLPGALDQIIDNFIDNALAVVPPDSTISVDVSVDRVAGTATVSVADRGPGMTGEQIERAFDRFWRPASAAAGGSGLGLAIVRQLARATGGTASLARRPGGGVIASATLPLATAT
jgi:signal transduction histidine kinase